MDFLCKPQGLSLLSVKDMNYFSTSAYLYFCLLRAEFILLQYEYIINIWGRKTFN